MNLHTQRLLIRNFQNSDLEVFFNYRNDPLVAKYQSWSLPYSQEKAQAFINEMKDIHAPKQGQWLQLAVELKETGSLIGDVAFCIKDDDIRQATIGFTISSAYWNQGFATEALTVLLDYLFEDINLHRIVADCDTENIGSWKTLEKLSFRREAHFVESLLIDGVYTSEYHYGLLQREWRARNKPKE
ncbi:MAG: GNAT family N-acetyltransferase [Anaerolineales bacterium]|nr:GNAT family N-acetyltransferase [Anaerolineales bacterium]